MEMTEGILSRASIRQFTSQPISEADLHTILQAGMSGPCCKNLRDWSFLVVRDKERLQKMADANGAYSKALRNAAVGILVCGDLNRALSDAPEYWIIDGAIAAQNMTLAAHGLGLASVWLGTWPRQERLSALRELFSMPETAVPHSILAVGYPAPDARTMPRPAFEEDRVHYETW